MIFRKKPKDSTGEMPQWEHDFFLYEPDPYHIPHAYLDTGNLTHFTFNRVSLMYFSC